MKNFVRLIGVACLVALIQGCSLKSLRAPLLCDSIIDQGLSGAPLSKMDMNALVSWLKSEIHLTDTQIKVYTDTHGEGESVSWTVSDRTYDAYIGLYGSGRTRIDVNWLSRHPTVQEALNCYGRPDRYQAGYFYAPEASTSLYLFYQSKGLVLYSAEFSTMKRVMYDTDISGAMLMAPTTAEDMLAIVHPANGSWPRFRDAKSLRPWPSKLEDIIIDTDAS